MIFAVTTFGNIFGSPDDYCTYAARYFDRGCMYFGPLSPRSILEASWVQATGQGRFYQFFYYTLAQIPFMADSFLALGVVRILSTLLLLHSLFAFSTILFGRLSGFLTPLVFVAIYSVNGDYNALTGLPLWFGLGQISILYAVVAASKFISGNRLKDFFIFLFLFVLGILSYEAMWLIVPTLFFALKHSSNYQQADEYRDAKNRRLVFKSILGTALVYGASYLLFSKSFPSSYAGTQISLSDPIGIVVTTLKLGVGHVSRNTYSLAQLLLHPEIAAFVILVALSAFWFFGGLGGGSRLDYYLQAEIDAKKSITPIRVSIIFLGSSLLPGALLALTARYREISSFDPLYLTSLYSGVLQSVGISVLILGFLKFKSGTILKSTTWALILFFASLNTLTNISVFQSQVSKQWIYEAVEKATSVYFNRPESSSAIPISVEELQRYAPTGVYNFWQPYLRAKTGYPVIVSTTETNRSVSGAELIFVVNDELREVVLTLRDESD
jgi:hypothetical protein